MKIGDAPSQYFFKLVQAKRIRETIKNLALPNGRITQDEFEILHGVYTHCRNLYRKDPRVERFKAVRDEALALITRKFTASDNCLLRSLPTGDEIEKVVMGFPKGKSPGGDGVTYDFLQGCWGFVGDCYKDMILAFWNDAKLSANTVNGIVKMMPKRTDSLEILDNWRNLTMLTTTYKIISKILVERFKPIILKVVDCQQTGFVQGRCITDNIISFMLGQEHAVATYQDVIFMKLDFEKASARVDHDYLWATLNAMQLDPFIITLIQGLV